MAHSLSRYQGELSRTLNTTSFVAPPLLSLNSVSHSRHISTPLLLLFLLARALTGLFGTDIIPTTIHPITRCQATVLESLLLENTRRSSKFSLLALSVMNGTSSFTLRWPVKPRRGPVPARKSLFRSSARGERRIDISIPNPQKGTVKMNRRTRVRCLLNAPHRAWVGLLKSCEK